MTRETIVRLAARGDGVTEGGRYVQGTAPGDVVSGDAVMPGPHRVGPACVHFGACGGCQLQHVDEVTLADFVTGRIVGALDGVGVSIGQVHPAHLSPPGSRRRASLRAVRAANEIRLGFNSEGSSEIVDLSECYVLTPGIWTVLTALRSVLPPILRSGHAIGITLTETLGGYDLLLSNANVSASAFQALAAFAEVHGIARITVETAAGMDIAVQLAEPVVRLDGVLVGLPPGGFLQATRDGEAALQSAVGSICSGARSVADLFCGIGTFAVPLSANTKVFAADAAGPALETLARAARQAGRHIQTEHRDLFRQPLDARSLEKYDAVVLDPPRAGAKAQTESLAKSKVKKIAYVSCNPNTFARDAKRLVEAGYRLTELWPVGQFRWSTHVELVASFSL